MKILIVHNYYQLPGGEDSVVQEETRLLESRGHQVVGYFRDNREIASYPPWKKLMLLRDAAWSQRSYDDLQSLCRKERFDIAHLHNTLPLVTPAAYYACRSEGVPCVQTLHNYRLICPGSYLARNGRICESCVSGNLWPALWYGCYRNSRLETFAITHMLQSHRKRGTWAHAVDRYIVLTEFAKARFATSGIPADKLCVKPNFVSDLRAESQAEPFALFLGRLDRTKGIGVLLKAWPQVSGMELVIAGDGPERARVEAACAAGVRMRYVGRLKREEALRLLGRCAMLVQPSLWYEGFPMTLVEAYAMGCPVVASRIGSLSELVRDGVTGLLFTPGNAADLSRAVQQLVSSPSERERMGREARREYEARYTAERNYVRLMEIYTAARASFARMGDDDPAHSQGGRRPLE